MGILKKILIVIFIMDNLFAINVNKIKANIIENIAGIFVKKKEKNIYINSIYFNPTKKFLNKNFKIINNCNKADIAFVEKPDKCKTIIFLTSYINYLKYKNNPNIAGVFFWQKGRPTIIIKRNFIIKHHIKLPKEYLDFIDE